jgi:hypothetical protein
MSNTLQAAVGHPHPAIAVKGAQKQSWQRNTYLHECRETKELRENKRWKQLEQLVWNQSCWEAQQELVALAAQQVVDSIAELAASRR